MKICKCLQIAAVQDALPVYLRSALLLELCKEGEKL